LPSIFESQIRRFRGDVLKNGKNGNQTIIQVSFIYLFIYLTIYIAPSIPDESAAAPDIDRLLIPKEEWLESFPSNPTVKDIIREILKYIPIDIPFKKGGPKNIDQSIHWNPLRIFLLFFLFPVLQIICDSTNSFAIRNHTA
jgi:hypothetical protein